MMRISERALEAVEETDWSKAKIKVWSRGLGNIHVIDIDKETKTFIWVTFEGASFRLRKTDFFCSSGVFDHAFLRGVEFGLLPDYVAPPLPKEECDNCGMNLPNDAGFEITVTCLENDDPDDDFESHLCHECFGRIEKDVFKKNRRTKR